MNDVIARLNAALEGRYRIQREIGEGGMATVYLAEDLKHERQVAIKVLRPELVAVIGAERFLAEIKTTANLQHPHILPLFDSGEADGFLYYVMPYVEGESLRERLEREYQLPVEEAVRIARDVADALDYAHRQRVIHRDIKPANILLHDGRPVVADFGIALAVSAAAGGRLTETGLSLGTPHYMSPEQASADRDVTARADVYSLGSVLYEMLAGQPPYTGPTAQSVLARILTEDPKPLGDLRRTVPPHVASAVMKSIEKLPADRFASAADFRAALEDPGFRYTPAASRPPGHARARPAAATPPAESWLTQTRSRIAVGLVALLTVALAFLILAPDARTPEGTGGPPVRTLLDLGNLSTTNPQFYPVTISPDGSRFAVIRDGDEGNQIYYRTAEDMEFRPVPGAEGQIFNLAFSPDSEWIVYSGDSGLMRVSLLGGEPTQLLAADSIESFMLDWGVGGWIAFYGRDAAGPGTYRLPDTGGPVERLLGTPEWTLAGQPSLLPDGSGLLFSDDERGIALYEFEADSARVLLPTGGSPVYTRSRHLVYIDKGGGLWAVPFDLDANEVEGDPKPALQGVMAAEQTGSFSISRNGTLVYTAGPAVGRSFSSEIVVAGVDGPGSVLKLPARRMFAPRWAPDGRSIAYQGGEPGDEGDEDDIYIYDIESQNAPTRLTNRGTNREPVFSPDGSRLVFASIREGTEDWDLFIRNLTDDAPPSLLISLPGPQFAKDWPEDSLIVVESGQPSAAYTVTLDGDTARYYAPDADIDDMRVAPNGALAAYVSDESGENEVYIRAFPTPRIETIVSEHVGPANSPMWSDDGDLLYYTVGDSIWAAGIELEPAPTVISRQPVLPLSNRFFTDLLDGRFLGAQVASAEGTSDEADEPIRYIVIHDWFTELERIFEGDR